MFEGRMTRKDKTQGLVSGKRMDEIRLMGNTWENLIELR